MKYKAATHRQGFTLIELMVTMTMSAIVILGVGLVLADSQRGWSRTYDRVHSEVITDAYVARRTFDAAVRKASMKRHAIGIDGDVVEVYYYQNPQDMTVSVPDRYANFYLSGTDLQVDHGPYNWATRTTGSASRTSTLARNVTSVNFIVDQAAVRMVLSLDNGTEDMTVMSTAYRRNGHND